MSDANIRVNFSSNLNELEGETRRYLNSLSSGEMRANANLPVTHNDFLEFAEPSDPSARRPFPEMQRIGAGEPQPRAFTRAAAARAEAERVTPSFAQGMMGEMQDAFRNPLRLFRSSNEEVGFGISKTAEGFLALSSIMRPISPMLSNTFMSAGFASFSTTMGALPALLAIGTAAIAAWAQAIAGWIETAREAGFTTQRYERASENLNNALENFAIRRGAVASDAFDEAADSLARLVEGLEEMPFDDLIRATGEVTANFLEIVELLNNIGAFDSGVGILADMGISETLADAINQTFGLEGDRAFDQVSTAQGLFREFREAIFGSASDINPLADDSRFRVRSGDDISGLVQRSILASDDIGRRQLTEAEEQTSMQRRIVEMMTKFFPQGDSLNRIMKGFGF